MFNDKVIFGYSLRSIWGFAKPGTKSNMWVHYINDNEWIFDEEGFDKYWCSIANCGPNFCLTLPYNVWLQDDYDKYGKGGVFQPYKFIKEQNLWDLSQWNNYYWPIVGKITDILNKYGTVLGFPFYDQCQNHDLFKTSYRRYSPYSNNIQGFEIQNGSCPGELYPYMINFANKALDELSNKNVMFSLGNELLDVYLGLEFMKVVRDRQLDPKRMLYGSCQSNAEYLGNGKWGKISGADEQGFLKGKIEQIYAGTQWAGDDVNSAKMKYIKETHGCLIAPSHPDLIYGLPLHESIAYWGNHPWIRGLFSDDGTYIAVENGGNPNDGDGYYIRPGSIRWHDGFKYILDNCSIFVNQNGPRIGIEHLPKNLTLDVQIPVLQAIARAYKERFGIDFYNVNRYIWISPKKLTTIIITPKNSEIKQRKTVQFSEIHLDQHGENIDAKITWELIGNGQFNNNIYTAGDILGNVTIKVTGVDKNGNSISDSAIVNVIKQECTHDFWYHLKKGDFRRASWHMWPFTKSHGEYDIIT